MCNLKYKKMCNAKKRKVKAAEVCELSKSGTSGKAQAARRRKGKAKSKKQRMSDLQWRLGQRQLSL